MELVFIGTELVLLVTLDGDGLLVGVVLFEKPACNKAIVIAIIHI